MSIHSINHVQLAFAAGEQAKVRHFYVTLLGLTELKQPAGSTLRFALNGQRIDLVPTENWVAAPAVSHLAFEVQDLPRLRRRLLDAHLVLEESRPLSGHLRFYASDPAGNQLEFLEPDPSQASTV